MRAAAICTALAVAAALALTTCGGGDDDGGESSAAPPTPAEAYSAIVAEIAEQGSSPELALEAFALVFGPIPGVEPPETSEGPGLQSGTGLVSLAIRHFDDFSAEQRKAIEERLIPTGPAPDEEEGQEGDEGSATQGALPLPLASIGGTRLAQQTDPSSADEEQEKYKELVRGAQVNEELTADANRIREGIKQRIGGDEDQFRHVELFAADDSRDPAFGWTLPVHPDPQSPSGFRLQTGGNRVDTCLVAITPLGRSDPNLLTSTLAQESFDCMGGQLLGMAKFTGALPFWVNEGTGEWVGEAWAKQFTRDTEIGAYLTDRGDLFSRNYDAVGFFAQLDGALEGRLWPHLPDILRAGAGDGSTAAFNTALAADPILRTVWAPQHAQRRDLLPELWWQLDLHELRAPEGLEAPVEEVDVARGLAEEGPVRLTDECAAKARRIGCSAPARTPTLFELSFPSPDEAETETVTLEVSGNGAGAWVGIGGRAASRTWLSIDGDRTQEYCLDPEAECELPARPLPSETLMLGVVGLEGNSEIVVSGEGTCPRAEIPAESPEHAICAHLEETRGKGDIYAGDCREAPADPYGSFCSDRPGSPGNSTSEYVVRADDADIHLRLRQSGDGWDVVGERVVGPPASGN